MLTNLFLGQVQICFSECMYPELEVISAHNLAFLVNIYYSFKIQLKYRLLSKTFLGTCLPRRVKNALFCAPAWLFML